MERESLHAGEYLPLIDAAKLLRGKGGRQAPCIRTMRRWITRGVLSRGRRVYLQAVKINGHFATTREWVEEFNEVRIEIITPPEPLIRSRRAELPS